MTVQSSSCGARPVTGRAPEAPEGQSWAAVLATAREWLGTLRWWFREFSGETAYEKYVARHRLEHPGHEPMCARDFWRKRDADAEHNIQAGCC